jgi:hypothetical protein
MKVRALAVLAALAWLNTGCESDCERVCEKSRECSNENFDDSFLGDASCGDLCDLSEDLVELVGCEEQWDDYIACTADNLPENCNDPVDACRSESEAYGACFDDD